MDRYTLLINAPAGEITYAATLLNLLARYKGLMTAFYDMTPARESCVEHNGLRTSGFWPSADFIMDLRPYPSVLDNEVRTRTTIRSTTHKLLMDPRNLVGVRNLYTPDGTPRYAQTPTLIDFATAAYADTPYGAREPWVKAVAAFIHNRIEQGI